MRRLIRSSRMAAVLLGAGLGALAGSASARAEDAAPVTPLPMHRAARAPLPSPLPAPALVGAEATRLQRAYGGTPIDVTTFHYDTNRTGWNPTETDLTPASVASAKFGLLATLRVDGNVFAQPLLVSNYKMPDGATRDVLVIATGHDSVYAFDAKTYMKLWQVSLGQSQSTGSVGCGDVHPEYGISGTPVIVRGKDGTLIYLVAATEPAPGQFVSTLHALDLGTGQDALTPQIIAPSATLSDGSTIGFDPQNQWNRAGLAYHNGSIYIGIGSHCDSNAGAITGWLLRYTTKLAPQQAFHTIGTPAGYELSSIWMTGFAPAIDAGGNVFVVTGNGAFSPAQHNWGESVLKLPASLSRVASYFTPQDFNALNGNDTDFGSGGVMLLPPVAGQSAPPLAVAMGKASELYLLNQTSLGKLHSGDTGAVQAQSGNGSGLWGGPAYYDGPSGPMVFTQTGWDVLRGWSVATGASPSLSNTVNGASGAGYGGSLPIVSSNGAAANTGVLWLINRATEPFALEAYDAVALGAPIFSARIGTWSNAGQGNPFLTPMQANGRVYAPGYKLVRVFGLAP